MPKRLRIKINSTLACDIPRAMLFTSTAPIFMTGTLRSDVFKALDHARSSEMRSGCRARLTAVS